MSRPGPGDAPGASAAMARSPLQANRDDLSESLEAFLAARYAFTRTIFSGTLNVWIFRLGGERLANGGRRESHLLMRARK